MVKGPLSPDELTFRPVTSELWDDLETLFGANGACSGCWCMWWRLTRADFGQNKGAGNRAALKALVDAGEVPGLLAYADGQPVGWCSLGPREVFGGLERSRLLTRVDEQPVWSVVCFYIARAYRRRGLMAHLLRAAVAYAREQGAHILEGYPVEPGASRSPLSYYMGVPSAFLAVGFVEVLRRAPNRPVMRLSL